MEEKKINSDDLINAINKINPTAYNSIKNIIEREGFFSIGMKDEKPVKVYNIKLAMLFYVIEIPEYAIDTIPYFETYCKAYKKGLKDFKKDYLPNENMLFGEYKEQFANRLNIDCFGNDLQGNQIESTYWYSVKNKIGFVLTHDIIKQYGYNSGLISEVDRVMDKYFDTPDYKQTETVKPDDVKKELYNDYFKYNAFEVFEKYKENKQINVNSRTDLRVIFELLKEDNLLVDTFELKHYISWLNRVYYNGGITELKKQNLHSKPNIQRINDYNEYKKTTLKTTLK